MENSLFSTEANIFDALAHPARLEILEILRGREACVCHIQAMSKQRQAYISQQLNILRQAGLVTSRKDGQWMFYRASNQNLYALIDQVKVILMELGEWHSGYQEEQDLEQRGKNCNCPQCSTGDMEPACISLEGSCDGIS